MGLRGKQDTTSGGDIVSLFAELWEPGRTLPVVTTTRRWHGGCRYSSRSATAGSLPTPAVAPGANRRPVRKLPVAPSVAAHERVHELSHNEVN